jgi:uncharacterized membrane protein
MDLLISVVYAAGAVVCHQLPDRSFFWNGHQLPVCARCTGLYVSAGVALLAWPAIKLSRAWRPLTISPALALRVLAIAAVPTVVTYLTGVSGVWDGSNLARAVLAIPLGAAAGATVAAVFTKDLR